METLNHRLTFPTIRKKGGSKFIIIRKKGTLFTSFKDVKLPRIVNNKKHVRVMSVV